MLRSSFGGGHAGRAAGGPRWLALWVLACCCLFPMEAHVSSYGLSTQRNFKGYQLSVTFPSAPQPSARERARVQDEQQRLLERATALAEKAFAHYVRGQHPYVAVRKLVLSEQLWTPDATFWRTSPFALLDGVEIVLFVQPNVPDRVRTQVVRDFLLSQLAKGGVLSTPADRAQFPAETDRRSPEHALELGLFSLSQVIYALRNRAAIDAAIARSAGSASGLHLQGIRATLDGLPITDALFEAALALPPSPRAQTIRKLLDLSPRTELAQVRTWAMQLDEHARDSYIDPAPPH